MISEPLPASPVAMGACLHRHRALLRQLVVRDVASRYRGSALGLLWSFVTPLLTLAVYTFVFGVVFKARFGDAAAMPDDSSAAATASFALALFCGLSVHSWLSDCLMRAPTIMIHHVSYVKKIVFPLEVLPVMPVLSAGFHFLMNLSVLLAALLLVKGELPLSALWLPLVLLPLIPLLLGMSWLLASLGTYLRDIAQMTGLMTTLLLFLSPVFYPLDALPEGLRPLLYANPITLIVEQMRTILLEGRAPDLAALAAYSAVSLSIMWIGFWWFTRTRRGFADIL